MIAKIIMVVDYKFHYNASFVISTIRFLLYVTAVVFLNVIVGVLNIDTHETVFSV